MEILFIGDVVGSLGREMVNEYLPKLKAKYRPHLTIVNGENAAGGRGITKNIYRGLLDAGADIITLGNHAWDNKEIFDFIEEAKWMVRPANFPDGTPGKGMALIKAEGTEFAVINLQGRTFMNALDDPFRKAEEMVALARKRTHFIFVDFHAETTSEKQAMGWFLDGKVSAVIGDPYACANRRCKNFAKRYCLSDRCRHDRCVRCHSRYGQRSSNEKISDFASRPFRSTKVGKENIKRMHHQP